MHVRSDVSSRRAAISQIEIDGGLPHQRARTRATGCGEPRPYSAAPLQGTGLTEA